MDHSPPFSSRQVRTFAVGATALAATMLAAPPALAGQHDAARPATPVTVAHGLDNPRLLSTGPHGSLLVAEAGTGGDGACVTGGEGGEVCLGRTGAITLLRHGHQRRVLSRLPSLAGEEGDSALGPADVRFERGRLVVSMGAGIDAATRAKLGRGGRLLGTLAAVGRKHHHHHGWRAAERTARHRHARARVLADLVAFENRTNPDHSEARDSDPTGFVKTRRGHVLTDAGGNDLLRIGRAGRIHVLAVFPDRMVPFPPEAGGGEGPMQAVPTSVVRGPDGAFYVSQLTGFPFPVGAANIWRVVPGQQPTVYASGLTNVTDLGWHHGKLYAVQIADGGLLAATGLPMGSLVHVRAGDNSTPDVVAGGLPAPYGVAFRNRSAFVTTCSVCPDAGAVVKVPVG